MREKESSANIQFPRCADQIYIGTSSKKSLFFFSITCWTRHYFVIFFIYCSVSVSIEKIVSIDLLGIIR